MTLEQISPSPAATAELGRWLGERLWPGSFVALTGDLGAGKTVLATGILAGLGVERTGGSPTFTLLWEYRRGRIPAYHWDLYRLASPADLEELGYEESFYGDGVCIVEWAERVRELWPPEHLEIALGHGAAPAEPGAAPAAPPGAAPAAPAGSIRRVRLTARGERYGRLLEERVRAGAGA